MRQLILMVLLIPSLGFGAERYLLQSELRTNFADNGSSTQFLTGYTYDAQGNRVQSRVWSGADSTATPMSAVMVSYDAGGAVTEALQLSGADTSGIVRYSYGNGNLIAVRTLAKDGTPRFTDSLLYDGQGRNIEEQRIVAGVKTYFHRYTLNASGKTTADSLYELVSSAYVADQAVIFVYNPDSTVATETQWRLSGSAWYCISTAFMNYSAGSLVSVATHDRDGVGTGMTDSLAYAYDANGNRTKEEDYDGTPALVYRIVYTWRDTRPTISLISGESRGARAFAMENNRGRLTVDLASRDRGEISLYDMTGKRLCRVSVDHSGIVPLQGLIGKGSFIAIFTSGKNKQEMNFANLN